MVLGLNMTGNAPTVPAAGLAPSLEPELALLAACSRWPLDESAKNQLHRCATVPLDWERFVLQVTRHRVTSLVFHTLRAESPRSRPYATRRRRAGTLTSFLPRLPSSPRSRGRVRQPAS